MNEVSIVIPVFNNEQSLNQLFDELLIIKKKLNKKKKVLEIIFVDDGSQDNSLKKLRELKEKNSFVKIIKLTKNYGANEAVQIGLKNATGFYVSVLAADIQDDPNLILRMYENCSNGENLVICERDKRNDNIITKIFSNIFYFILKKTIFKNYPKNGFDVFMINRKLLSNLNLNTHSPTISLMIYSLGFKYKKILYDRKKREHGKSQWTFSKKLNLFWNIFIRYSDLPIKFISRIGLIISMLSFIYVFYIILVKFFFNFTVPGFATIVTSIAFFSGLIIFMLGIMGEYLVRIFRMLDKNESVCIEKIYD